MPAPCSDNKLVDLKRHIAGPVAGRFVQMVEQPLEKMLALSALNHMYDCVQQPEEGEVFFGKCIDFLNIQVNVKDSDLQKIPASGPLMVVSNHPFGALDGIVLGWLLNRVRSDVKIIGNYFLHQIPEMQPYIIPVDPFQTQNSVKRNLGPMKQALTWLRSGGVIGMFPAGEVAHWDISARRVTDPPWSHHAAALIQHTRAAVVPLYFSGRNSLVFQIVGMLHSRLRTAMLPRELFKKQSGEIKLTIGRPVSFSSIGHLTSRDALTRYLRLHTYLLGRRGAAASPKRRRFVPICHKPVSSAPLIDAVPAEQLTREINCLPAERFLLQHGGMHVYEAASDEIPLVLREIGRLREKAFRCVGEGTGLPCDLDVFDNYYRHIFLWDTRGMRIAGAYRIGHTDDILAHAGRKGLYTSTLFNLKQGFFDSLGPALELGRSFICPDYQKQYNALLTLWKGIGRYLVCNPQYTTLFGPVSISNDYQRVSKDLMIRFLRRTRSHSDLSRSVTARNPVRMSPFRVFPESIEDLTFENISAIISDLEHDGKGMPVLLRHYLKLHAAIIDFNIDPSFSRVMDGLLMVDLLKTDARLLKRFLGRDGFEAFMSHQSCHAA
jgi:putative hemolysin